MPNLNAANLKLISTNYEINGFVGKLFQDSKGTQILVPVIVPKQVQYSGVFQQEIIYDDFGVVKSISISCPPAPSNQNCKWVSRNGELTLVLKPGTIVN